MRYTWSTIWLAGKMATGAMKTLCKFEESNLLNKMGLEFYDLSHPWGLGQPCWPYFEDVKIERLHGMSQFRRADAKDHHRHALRHAHRCARARRAGHAVHG